MSVKRDRYPLGSNSNCKFESIDHILLFTPTKFLRDHCFNRIADLVHSCIQPSPQFALPSPMATQFLSRVERESLRADDNSMVGPGTYSKPTGISKALPGFAPFASSASKTDAKMLDSSTMLMTMDVVLFVLRAHDSTARRRGWTCSRVVPDFGGPREGETASVDGDGDD